MVMLTPVVIADRENNVQQEYNYISHIVECDSNNFTDEVREANTEYVKLAEIEPHEATETFCVYPQLASLGEFTITYYCACEKCCGKEINHPAYGITASGTVVEEGRTIAVDPTVIPLGETVIIDGHEYIAEDTGSSIIGNRIDIYIADHQECLQMGVEVKEVYVRPLIFDIE